MKRSYFIGGAALAAVGVAGWLTFHQEKPKAPPPPEIPVTAVPVYVRGLGTVQAFNTVLIKSRVDGQITKVEFTEGAEVKAGDPLFQIDPRPYQATLDQATANLEKDSAQLQGAKLDLDRYSKLATPGFQTRQSVDDQSRPTRR